MKKYTITEASEICEISASTLRYYEEEGLLTNIKRENNRRVYTEKDIEKIKYLKCFRELGMTIQNIKDELSKKSLDNLGVKQILVDHLNFLEEKQALINKNIEIIKNKLNEYKENENE